MQNILIDQIKFMKVNLKQNMLSNFDIIKEKCINKIIKENL